MITRHCSSPSTSLPLPLYPFLLCPKGISCQLGSFPPASHCLPWSMASATTRASVQCSGWSWPPPGGTRENGHRKHFLGLPHMHRGSDAIWHRVTWSKYILNIEKRLAEFTVEQVLDSAIESFSGTAAAELSHMPSVTEWQGPDSKENKQIPMRDTGN